MNNQPNNEKKQKEELLAETLKLVTICMDSLIKCSMVLDDPQAKGLLEQAIFRQMESRYWLTEAIEFQRIKSSEANRVKAN